MMSTATLPVPAATSSKTAKRSPSASAPATRSTWSGDLSYTDYFGAGRYNLLNDRDFVAFNIKYSF